MRSKQGGKKKAAGLCSRPGTCCGSEAGLELPGTPHSLVEIANAMMLVLDTNAKVRYINTKGARILGLPRKHIIGKDWVSNFIPERLRKQVKKVFRSVRAVGHVYGTNINPVLTKRGERIIEWHNSTIKNRSGKTCHILSSGVDVTERERARAGLDEKNRFLETLISNLPGMVYRCRIDRDWTMDYVKGCRRLTGFASSSLLSRRVSYGKRIIAEEDRDMVWKRISGAVKRHRPFELEYRIKTKNGKIRWVWERGTCIYRNGKPIALEGFITNITERKELENRISDYNRNLEEEIRKRTSELLAEKRHAERMSKSKDTFLRNITHDLRTPLSVIIGNIGLLKGMAPIGKEREWFPIIEMLERNSARLENSINGILQLTAIDTAEVKMERVDLKGLVEELYRGRLPAAEAKGIELKPSLEPVVVYGDRKLLSLAVDNIIGNAVKFTEKGTVGISLNSNDTAEIVVSDTGIGISARQRKRIFTKFKKANPMAPGTGIGLTLAEKIVKMHRGRIDVKSALGKGSTFKIIIPHVEKEKSGRGNPS